MHQMRPLPLSNSTMRMACHPYSGICGAIQHSTINQLKDLIPICRIQILMQLLQNDATKYFAILILNKQKTTSTRFLYIKSRLPQLLCAPFQKSPTYQRVGITPQDTPHDLCPNMTIRSNGFISCKKVGNAPCILLSILFDISQTSST